MKDLAGPSPAAGEALFPVGREYAKSRIFKSPVEMASHDLLGFFALVGIDANADKVAGGLDDILLAELTVRRLGIPGSEDTRDASALGGGGHKENGTVRAFGLGQSVLQNGIPDESGRTDSGG